MVGIVYPGLYLNWLQRFWPGPCSPVDIQNAFPYIFMKQKVGKFSLFSPEKHKLLPTVMSQLLHEVHVIQVRMCRCTCRSTVVYIHIYRDYLRVCLPHSRRALLAQQTPWQPARERPSANLDISPWPPPPYLCGTAAIWGPQRAIAGPLLGPKHKKDLDLSWMFCPQVPASWLHLRLELSTQL